MKKIRHGRMLEKLIDYKIPKLLDRDQMLSLMLEEVYGQLPPKPSAIRFEEENNIIPNFCAGKATCHKVTAFCTLQENEFSFPFYVTLPADCAKHPFFVHINFRPNIPDRYQPTEELIDGGFAVLSFDYNDITRDDGDFTNGLAGILFPDGKRASNQAGKIAMWAWAAHRLMDYAETLPDLLDLDSAIVSGHSRLGKTALLAAATDERFAFAYSNDSGCSGAAITRKKQGETVAKICEVFPYWFCENYKKYMDHEENMPFDQHFLVASIAPRKVLIGSASEDLWADPVSEQLCCFAASPAFEKGFACPDREAEIGEEFLSGDIGYHLRKGLHYFSREDWNKLIKFVNYHRGI